MAGPEKARAEDLIYLDSPRHQKRVAESAARCVLALPGTRMGRKTILEVSDPKLASVCEGCRVANARSELRGPGFTRLR